MIVLCLLLDYSFAQKIPYGDNCYNHISKIWQKDSNTETFYARIKLYEIPPNVILDSFYSEFRNYQSGIYFYESKSTFMNLAPIQYKGYLFSNIVVIDKKLSNNQCYMLGHFLRNFSLMNFPNLNYTDGEIIKIESMYMKEKFDGNCSNIFEPIFFKNNMQDWIKNKSLIEETIFLFSIARRKYSWKRNDPPNGLFQFEYFIFSGKRQSYLNIQKIKSKLGIREEDRL